MTALAEGQEEARELAQHEQEDNSLIVMRKKGDEQVEGYAGWQWDTCAGEIYYPRD